MGEAGRNARRALQVAGAFFRVGYQFALSYPLTLLMSVVGAIVPVFVYFFVASLVDEIDASVGGDYFTFVIIGVIALYVLSSGIEGFSVEIAMAIQQGRLEVLLVEPIRWRLLPFGLTVWDATFKSMAALFILGISLLLGAHFSIRGIPVALVLLALGLLASLAIGILAASVRILSKRSDPVVVLYTLAASVLSGVFFPVRLLPDYLRQLSWVIPHTYAIDGLRKVLMPGGASLPGLSTAETILALVAFNAVVFPLALWIFGRSMDYARRMGILAGY